MQLKATTYRNRIALWLSNTAKDTCGWIRKHQRPMLVATGWAIGISLIIIKAYWFFYLENPRFSMWKLAYRSWEGPLLSELDWLLLWTVSLAAVLCLDDVRTIFWSFVVSIPISVMIAVAFASCFIWSVLGYGGFLSANPYDWEWVVLLATFNVSRMTPFVMLFCFLGVVPGVFLKSWLGDRSF